MARFIQGNKTVKSLVRYHTIMLKNEITMVKLHQMDVTEIRKQPLHTGGRKINKDMYARPILMCVGSDEA